MSVPVTGQIVRPPQAPLFPQFITTGVQIDSGFGNIGVGAIVAGTATMDLGTNDWYSLTLVNGTSTNVAVTNAMVGQQFTFRLIQDGSANGTVSWFNGIRWASGSPPTLTNTNGAVDTLTFKCVATNSYDGFTTVGGGSGSNGTVTQVNTTNGLTGGPITGTGNAGLAPIATVTLLGNPTNSSAIPSAVTLGPGLAFAGSTLQSFGGSLVGAANVAAGGTGDATLTAHAVLLGEGTSPVAFATVGTAGRVLTDQGASADPAFASTGLLITQHSGAILTHANTNGTVTLDLSQNDWIKVAAVTGNFTLAVSNATNGQQFSLILSQNAGSGNFNVTWFNGITWIGSPFTAPSMPVTNGAVLTATFKTTGTNNYLGWWLGNSAT